ncbi:MAG: hypothetical protein V2J42_12025 [Wenzhouxiangella sp.]|jgi:ABC-type bacteriocin/lantibiotic exporter with double-glycine peptidase domain|nr:hypothetical protein [Wenzhouxiangella sp.]
MEEVVLQYLVFGASVSVFSWIVGLILIFPLAKSAYYQRLQHLNFIPSATVNRYMGIWIFRWIVRDTPFRFFNPTIRLTSGRADLARVRDAMTHAEISHLIGFFAVVLVALYMSVTTSWLLGLMIMMANTLLNLYPSLLQQENKRRIDRLIARGPGAARS